jgi:hypothetical protein
VKEAAAMNERPTLPKLFATVADVRLYFGVSKTRLYDHFAKLDPGILVQVGGRTLVDVERLKALIDAMPRGPRKTGACLKTGRR